MRKDKQKEYLTSIIKKLVETNIELMTYYKLLASDEKSKRVCSKSIRQSKKALEELPHIKHLEILVSLYNTLVVGKENTFVLAGALICSKQMYHWDKTEKGFQEFLEIEKQAHEKNIKDMEEKRKTAEAIKKAKDEGKKVEMVYDPTTKKAKPLIVEDK